MEHEVFIPVPAETLREALRDHARVARCVPGLQQDADESARPLSGRLKVRVGGHTITYRGALTLTERAGAFTAKGEGSEIRGTGSAGLNVRVRLREEAGGTTVSFTATSTSEGRLAEIAPTTTEATARRLLDRFTTALGASGGVAQDESAGGTAGADGSAAADAADAAGSDRDDTASGPTRGAKPGGATGGGAGSDGDSAAQAAPSGADGGAGREAPAAGTADAAGAGGSGARAADGDGSDRGARASGATPGAKPQGAGAAGSGDAGDEAGGAAGAAGQGGGGTAAGAADDAGQAPQGAGAGDPDGESGAQAPDASGDEAGVPDPDAPGDDASGARTPDDSDDESGVPDPDAPGVPDSGEFDAPVPPSALDASVEFGVTASGEGDFLVPLDPPAEAAHARRTMIGRSAEEVDHAPPRGRYAPERAPDTGGAGAALRWVGPAAALAIAGAVVVGRALRRRR
ncbi:Carbon monoxide dehydrogenase subunit G (CoxG) [Streptomyces sp. S4.7]|uniref:SRPBCC domain-containing protein n=1 Tax=Streptomyces sp. S4.7 TaxID=2705439 RepID=UPI001398AA4C|nr:SRPBCC domain-containing protein [Streptomyces sp. S4.7]QHY97123.1 Carbon monoxide dehydrogenase subunit G (CoxG) [Streptomyces sp. S4.7]